MHLPCIKTMRLFIFEMDNCNNGGYGYVCYVCNVCSHARNSNYICKRIALRMFGTTDYRTRDHQTSHYRPIRDLLVDNRIMDSLLVDNVRQKLPIGLKELVTRHQILSLKHNINFHRNYLPLIFNTWPEPIIKLCFSGTQVNV